MHRIFIFLFIISANAYASKALVPVGMSCAKLFEGSKQNNLVTKTERPTLPAVISAVRYEMIVEAMKSYFHKQFAADQTYRRAHFSSDQISDMLKIGIPKQEVAAEIRETLQEQLLEMSKIHPIKLLPKNTAPRTPVVEDVYNPQISINEFVDYYNLNTEREAVTKILSFNEQYGTYTARPIEVLKAAMFTGQSDLAREAFIQSFRFNDMDDLVNLGIETGNNEMLMQLGRIGIARYLLFDRNQNYLHLDALLEIKGKDKEKAVAMLLNFSDVLRGHEMIDTETSVNNYQELGRRSEYLERSIDALIAASTLIGRTKRDSTSSRRFVETTDKKILDRVRGIIKTVLEEKRTFTVDLYKAAVLLNDPQVSKSLSDHYMKIRYDVDKKEREFVKERFPTAHARRALTFSILSGDFQHTVILIKEILKDLNLKEFAHLRNGYRFYGEDYITLGLKNINLDGLVLHLDQLLKDESLDKSQREFLIVMRKSVEEAKDQASKNELNLDSDMFVSKERDTFSHTKRLISDQLNKDHALKDSPSLWYTFLKATSERDVKKLEAVYNKMMAEGLADQAIEVAFSIAVIESGGDTTELFMGLENKTAVPRLENK
jgi:hypothetical protein